MNIIKTKYKLRQVVWFMHENKITSGRITYIKVSSEVAYPNLPDSSFMKDDNDKLSIRYHIRRFSPDGTLGSGNLVEIMEKEVYETKTKIIKSIS